MTNANTINQQPIVIHKEGEEGTLLVDRLTGRITTPHNDRPDWAEGYAAAMLAERNQFYQARLGDGQAYQDIEKAEAIEATDLSWIGVDAEGDEIEIEASNDYRMDLVANALGMDRESGELTGDILASHEVDRENGYRTQEEMAALEESLEQGFGGATQAEVTKQTGTN